MSVSLSLEPVNMLTYMAKGTLKMWLSEWSWDWEIILDYPDELNLITRVITGRRQEGQWQKKKRKIGRHYIAGFEAGEWGYEPWNRGSLQKLEKEMDPLLELPEGTQAYCSILDFWTPELAENKSILFYTNKFVVICYRNNRKLTQLIFTPFLNKS